MTVVRILLVIMGKVNHSDIVSKAYKPHNVTLQRDKVKKKERSKVLQRLEKRAVVVFYQQTETNEVPALKRRRRRILQTTAYCTEAK